MTAIEFSRKKVLVCGGSDGIGLGIAKAFKSLGATVAITGTRSDDNYENDITELRFYQLDVQDSDSIASLRSQLDQLDVLVNSVGAVLWKKAEFEREGFEKILSINLSGAMELYMAFQDLLRESGGSIVSIDSVASINPAINNPAYSASKAGLVQLTRSLAKKWGPEGIRVNTVAPGLVPTKMTVNQSGPEQEAQFSKVNPIGRFGTPEDIAGAVVFLASPLASYITGQQIIVDGGLTL